MALIVTKGQARRTTEIIRHGEVLEKTASKTKRRVERAMFGLLSSRMCMTSMEWRSRSEEDIVRRTAVTGSALLHLLGGIV